MQDFGERSSIDLVVGGAMIQMIATRGVVVSAVAAAALWYWASRVTVKVRPFDQPFDPRHPNDMVQVNERELLITKQIGDDVIAILETASAQSRWNSYVALAAALSALIQAIALLSAAK